MMNYNTGDIGGYDIVISVTQSDVNAQFKRLFRRGRIDTSINVKLGDGTRLNAKLDAPTVLFKAKPDQGDQRVYLILSLQSGTFTTLDQREIEIKDGKVAIKVELKMAPISQREIEEHKGIPEEVKSKLNEFDEINFKVNQLFIDLKQSGRAGNIDRTLSTLPALSPVEYQSFGRLIEVYLQKSTGADNPYNLGYVPTSLKTALFESDLDRSRFKPTGVNFSITQNGRFNDNTLNYMLMTNHREFPSGPEAGIIKINSLRGNVMRFSQKLFIEDLILARIQQELEMPKFTGSDLRWYSQREKRIPEKEYRFGELQTWMEFREIYPCRVQTINGSHPQYGKCGILGISGQVQREVWYRYTDQAASSQLSGELSWAIKLYVVVSQGQMLIYRENPTWKVILEPLTEDWFQNVNRNGTPGAKEQARMVDGYLRYYTRDFLAMLRVNFTAIENHLILPAGDAFFFKDPEFKGALYGFDNLVLTLTYKSFLMEGQASETSESPIDINEDKEIQGGENHEDIH